ncbi:MAG TPA: GAF domain-containing protein [Gemmatimonadaceae bacterium]|nr:GAF domain-containing protein [Gemmatimonadaceae bacterium]
MAPDHFEALTARVAELEAERTRLAAMVTILQRVAGAANVTDAMVTVSHELAEVYSLDRSSIILLDPAEGARIVASSEDPSIRNLSIELSRYPEVHRAIASESTVFIADLTAEPMSWMVRETLRRRNVASAIVVPIMQSEKCVGALFLRTRRDRAPVTAEDIGLFESVAAMVGSAIAKAHSDAAAVRQQVSVTGAALRVDAQRIALVTFLDRLLAQFRNLDGQAESVATLTDAADADLDRAVSMVVRALGIGATKA